MRGSRIKSNKDKRTLGAFDHVNEPNRLIKKMFFTLPSDMQIVGAVLNTAEVIMPPTYSEIGQSAKDLLSGSSKGGAYILDPRLSYSAPTSSGVTFALSAIKKGDRVDGFLKAAYKAKAYSVDAAFDPAGKVTVSGAVSDVAPGLKVSGSVILPDPSSAKVGVEYAFPYLALKSVVALTSTPLVELQASTGYKGVVVGAETAYDTAKSTVSKYNLAVGYHAPDYQVAAFLTDKASTARLALAHNVTPTQSVGAEVTRKLTASDVTTFTLGYARKLESGALAKFKLDNTGLLTALYETRLGSGEKVAGSVQLQATDLNKPPKYGFALDLF